VTGQHRASQRHQSATTTPADPKAALRAWLRAYAKDHPRRGFRPAYHDARGEGWQVNHKKIQRLWREEGLRVPQRRRRKRRGTSTTIDTPTADAHDQWDTTIYSDNDRYRGIHNLRTLILMNRDDMRARHIKAGGLVDITATARDGSQRFLKQYRAIEYDMPRGCAAGYMPEMNVLIAASDYSSQSNQPLMKNIRVRVAPIA